MSRKDREGNLRDRARRYSESARVLRDLAAVDAGDKGGLRHARQERAVAKELQLESEFLERTRNSEGGEEGGDSAGA